MDLFVGTDQLRGLHASEASVGRSYPVLRVRDYTQDQPSDVRRLIRVASAFAFDGPMVPPLQLARDRTLASTAFYVSCRNPTIRVEETASWHLPCRGQGLV